MSVSPPTSQHLQLNRWRPESAIGDIVPVSDVLASCGLCLRDLPCSREKLKTGNIQVDPFRDFVETIVSGDSATAIRLLDASPLLAKERAAHGATRQTAKPNFFEQILHYMYEGDTALHIAAAAYQIRIAEELIAR